MRARRSALAIRAVDQKTIAWVKDRDASEAPRSPELIDPSSAMTSRTSGRSWSIGAAYGVVTTESGTPKCRDNA